MDCQGVNPYQIEIPRIFAQCKGNHVHWNLARTQRLLDHHFTTAMGLSVAKGTLFLHHPKDDSVSRAVTQICHVLLFKQRPGSTSFSAGEFDRLAASGELPWLWACCQTRDTEPCKEIYPE